MHVTVTLHGSPMCLRRGSDPHQGPVPHDRLGHGAVEPHRLGARFFWTNFAMSESFTCALPFPRNLARGTISSRIEVCFRLATGVDFSTRLSTWGIVLELKLPVNGELCTNMILTQRKAPKAALCSTPAVSDLYARGLRPRVSERPVWNAKITATPLLHRAQSKSRSDSLRWY